jgi:hypothetical protein
VVAPVRLLAFALVGFLTSGCRREPRATTPREMPTPTIQVGSCGEPGRDGVMGKTPQTGRADRDLNDDGVPEPIVVDRSLCTAEGNCYWNVFSTPPATPGTGVCARYVGTFAASALEPLTARGDDNMVDVRGYWNLHDGRMLLQSYRFMRGGYELVDALLCRRGSDDKLECMDDEDNAAR